MTKTATPTDRPFRNWDLVAYFDIAENESLKLKEVFHLEPCDVCGRDKELNKPCEACDWSVDDSLCGCYVGGRTPDGDRYDDFCVVHGDKHVDQ